MSTTRTRLVKGSTLVTATLGLGLGFVAMPTVGPASMPSAVPATNTPVRPTTTKVALADKTKTAVAQAGPSTRVIKDSSVPKDATGKPVSVPGKQSVDPALQAGAADDTVVTLAATGDMVGVTWPGDAAMAARSTVAVRARNAQGWQDWQELSIDPVMDQKTGAVKKYGTEPIFVDGATEVQVRVAPEAKAILKTASLSAVTSPKTDADAQLTPTSVPGAANAAYIPGYITRRQWGADESLRKGCVPTINPTSTVVIVHHTAGSNNYTAAQSASVIRGIYAYDTGSLGWCDVAYNMIVDKYGQKFEGRYGGLNRAVKGAHADSFNTRTFGISILGNYDVAAVPDAGMRALKQGIAMRISQFYINPYGHTTLYSEYNGTTSRYPKGAAYYANNIAGHRQSSFTACPGANLYPRLGELRSGAAALAGWNNGYPSPIYKNWIALGGAARYGTVAVGEGTVSTGLKRTIFAGGSRFYNSWAGTKIIGPGIDVAYWRLGGPAKYGVPTTNEAPATGGWYAHFSKGVTIAATRSGAISAISGALRDAWFRTGGPAHSTLGLPTAPGAATVGGWTQPFMYARAYARYDGRVYRSEGALLKAYYATGGPAGRLGMPTSSPIRTASGATQFFDHGAIRWNSTTGAVSIG